LPFNPTQPVSTRGLTTATRRRGNTTLVQPTLGLGRATTARAIKWISWGVSGGSDASNVTQPDAGEDR